MKSNILRNIKKIKIMEDEIKSIIEKYNLKQVESIFGNFIYLYRDLIQYLVVVILFVMLLE